MTPPSLAHVRMPGHVKKGGKQEQDPDPSPWLVISAEAKKEDSLKPYDAKKSAWVPDGAGGFNEALIESVDGEKVSVKVGWEPKTFKADQVMQMNPPKMEKFEDVSNMTYLNEAAVLWNLKARYVNKLIYVSKILPDFLIFISFYLPDLLWPLLCGYKPLQEVPNLHCEDLSDVHREEEE